MTLNAHSPLLKMSFSSHACPMFMADDLFPSVRHSLEIFSKAFFDHSLQAEGKKARLWRVLTEPRAKEP